uniref:Uncharacterized protein n=1 Tax=Medicago truncatula TaxID=3880 RepID=A2Q3K1_MEDTR|nr:hypothetical protein MtrDRAFT_AC155884g15v2 [Medicago truncatula]
MILLTQQIAQPLFIISYKSNPSFNNHVQLHQGFTLHTPFSQLPIMPLSNGRPFRRKNFNKCVSESGQSPLPTDPDKHSGRSGPSCRMTRWAKLNFCRQCSNRVGPIQSIYTCWPFGPGWARPAHLIDLFVPVFHRLILSKKDEIVGETSDGVVEVQGENPDLQTLFRRFWKVAAPYWSSDDKVQARLQLAGVFALTLATTGISVGFSFLGRDFYNALANRVDIKPSLVHQRNGSNIFTLNTSLSTT